MVFVGASQRGLVGVSLTGVERRKNEVRGRVINAQPSLGRVVDKRLGIDRAGEMHVQIGALGHFLQEGMQKGRLFAYRLKVPVGARFRLRLRGRAANNRSAEEKT